MVVRGKPARERMLGGDGEGEARVEKAALYFGGKERPRIVAMETG
jgi:hypothetical protein